MGRKTTVWIFQATNRGNLTQEDLGIITVGNHKRETESFLVAAQNNSIKTNNVQANIDNMQQNCKCRLCNDRNETINHIINVCDKLT